MCNACVLVFVGIVVYWLARSPSAVFYRQCSCTCSMLSLCCCVYGCCVIFVLLGSRLRTCLCFSVGRVYQCVRLHICSQCLVS